jgi:hypothetical protein
MRRTRTWLVLQPSNAELRTVLLSSVMLWGFSALAQLPESSENKPSVSAITGQPFSAIKFTRTVHVKKDGTSVVVAEKGHALLARNTDGRVFMSAAEWKNGDCDLPELGSDLPNLKKLPLCDHWGLHLFDPNAGVMWHWLDGEIGDKVQYVKVSLSSEQVAAAERLTSMLPDPPPDIAEPGVTVRALGEHDIEGVRATGFRTTTMHNDENGKPKPTIHEVWTSAQMHLVLKVVDGDPHGDEIVSGLDHISLAPELELFKPPIERILRQGKDPEPGMHALATWIVQ